MLSKDLKLKFRQDVERRLDAFLRRLDEENDFFDGEKGIRLSTAKLELQKKLNRETDKAEKVALKCAIIMIDSRYEQLEEIYK